jgi:tetratricopeptide (TPR) repeat protein
VLLDAAAELANANDLVSMLEILRIDFHDSIGFLPGFSISVIDKLIAVADKLFIQRPLEQARMLVMQLIRMSLTLPKQSYKPRLLSEVFTALLDVYQQSRAIEVVQSMPDTELNAGIFFKGHKVNALTKLVDLGEFNKVWEIVQSMPNREPKVRILISLLKSVDKEQQSLQVRTIAQQLRDSALGEQANKDSPRLLSDAAIVLSEAGYFDLAFDAAEAISETNDKLMSLLLIVYDITKAKAKVENLHPRIIALWTSVNLNQLVWDNYSDYTWKVMWPLFITSLAKINAIHPVYTYIIQINDISIRSTCIVLFLQLKASEINDEAEKVNIQRAVVHVLIKLSEFERAWQYTEVIQDNWQWSITMTELLTAIVIADDVALIGKLVDTISNERRNKVFDRLSDILSEHGYYSSAIEVAQKISDEQIRLCACSNVYANILPHVKEAHLAIVISEIIDLSQDIHDDNQRDEILSRSAYILARTGHIEDALTVILLVKTDKYNWHDDETMAIIVPELAQTSNYVALIQLAKWFAHGRQGLDLLHNIADASNDDSINECKALLNAVVSEVHNSSYEFTRNSSLHELVQMLLKINDIEDAIEIVQTLKDNTELWVNVAKKLVELGLPGRALALAAKKPDSEAATKILTGVAVGFTEMGEYSQAIKAIDTIQEKGYQVEAVSAMMKVMNDDELREIERIASFALAKVSSIDDDETRTWRVFSILPLLIQWRLWKYSLEAALLIKDHEARGEALRDIIKVLWQSQDISPRSKSLIHQLYEAATLLTSQRWRQTTMSEASRAFARIGDIDSALMALRTIDERIPKLNTLADLSSIVVSEAIEIELWPALTALFDQAQTLGHDGILSIIHALIPWLANLDQGDTLWQVYSDIQEIESWWGQNDLHFT